MRVRSRIAGAPRDAELRLHCLCGQRRFVLIVHEPDGRRVSVGRLTAAIGYELVDAAAPERAALTLAGFHLPEAGRRLDPSRRLTKVLRGAQDTSRPRGEARGPHFHRLPADRSNEIPSDRHNDKTKGRTCVFRK